MRRMPCTPFAVLLTATFVISDPAAHAYCGAFRQINSGGSYVLTPGYCTNGVFPCVDGGVDGSSVSPNLDGTFWHVGNGNPEIALGNDNGGVPPLGYWIYVYNQYPAVVKSSWSANYYDGCPDQPQPGGPAARCMAIVLTDLDPAGAPGFALLTSSADDGLNFSFAQPNDGPILLAPLPKLPIIASSRASGTETNITVALTAPALSGGLYLDTTGDDCAGVGAGGAGTALVTGYRVRRHVAPDNTPDPDDYTLGNWPECGPEIVPLGQLATCRVPCSGEERAWLSYSLVLDSGFELPIVGARSSRIECSPNVADPLPRNRVRPRGSRSVAPGR